jgi:hypothetical protein
MLDSVRIHFDGQSLGVADGLFAGFAVGHHAWELQRFGNPAAIVLAVQFDGEVHVVILRIEQHELEEADCGGDLRIRQPFDEFVRVLFIGSCVPTPPMDRFTLSFYSSAESAEAEREPSLLRISRVICGGSIPMTQTSTATVEWNPEKKHWQVVIQAGAEVVRRQCAKTPPDAADAQLQALALATARDEGYTLDEAHISIVR